MMFNLDDLEAARERWLNSRTLEQLERLYDGAWFCNNNEAMERYAARILELKALGEGKSNEQQAA